MTTRLAPADLDAIEHCANAATPGPWETTPFGNAPISARKPPKISRKGNGQPKEIPQANEPIVSLDNMGACGDPDCCPQDSYAISIAAADATFIAHARTDVPALLAEVRALRRLPVIETCGACRHLGHESRSMAPGDGRSARFVCGKENRGLPGGRETPRGHEPPAPPDWCPLRTKEAPDAK